jgi:hypothetical protein
MPFLCPGFPSRLEFLCTAAHLCGRGDTMALLVAFAFVCLVVVYDRLTHRL